MRAEDLRLEDLVSFSEGLVSLHGRRLIIHDVHAMAQLRKDLVDSLGENRARKILSRFGYYWGEADAAALKRIVVWESFEDWLEAGTRLHMLQGVARVKVKSLELGPGATLRMEIIWENSVEAEEHLIEFGPSPRAGCWIMLGYASGYATFCLGKPVYFVEETCRARGDRRCRIVGMDYESWGNKARSLEQVFQAEDIQGKIEELTTALRKKTLELARERKRARQGGPPAVRGLAEVRSRSYNSIFDIGLRVARFDSSVLITGESGVGKEIVARYIHENSPRRKKQFIAINCGALPETLLESELFGHKAGSFTGAIRDRAGLLEQAQGGTVLLDEIGDISPAMQVKLLRVLQEKQIRRVGENQMRKIDVRVIAATNKQLHEEIKAGRFRDDLYYRLRIVEIHIPPLRERVEDILPLARFFIEKLKSRLKLPRLKLHPNCIKSLESYPWPGNVRELENALEMAAIISEDGWIHPEHLPSMIAQPGQGPAAFDAGAPRSLAEVEKEYILSALEALQGNRTRAAKMLGISSTTLWRKLKEYEKSD
jgi:DNA-binding NtrC family response regulator/predicted hydrocarbon binding protein